MNKFNTKTDSDKKIVLKYLAKTAATHAAVFAATYGALTLASKLLLDENESTDSNK